MREAVHDSLKAVGSALSKHPSPEDASSVIKSTAAATIATGLNALVFYIGAFNSEQSMFLSVWLVATLTLCVVFARKSWVAAQKIVTHVSGRAARRLVQTSIVLAVPWAILPIYMAGFRATDEALILALVLAGMLAGGAFMLHRAYVASVYYMATITVAFIFSVHFGGWHQAWSITVYSIIYFIFLSFFAYRTGETAREKDASLFALSNALENLKKAHDENYLLANIDNITSLPNRKAFNEQLQQEILQCSGQCSGTGFTLLLIDLDRFKNVNDLFGHGVGDELLAVVARRFTSELSEKDTVARLGGDEFAVILRHEVEYGATTKIADRLIKALSVPVIVSERHVHTGASVGGAIFPQDARDPVEILLKADLALNRAKEDGRGQFVTFNDDLRQKVVVSNQIEAGLREALSHNQIFVEYQPKICLADGHVTGAEALVRMKKPDGSYVPPDSFLPVASERGLLPNVSRTIAEIVTKDIRKWRAAGCNPGKIAINIHPDDIRSPDFLMATIDMFEAKGITAKDLVLEITEGCFVGRGTDEALFVLDALSDRGYELSLDDFGTGHASLSHLKDIPVNEIKIDRSFVSGIEQRPDDRAIVSAIAEIARGMGIRSVAEGVETKEQLTILRELRLDLGQGYLWSRPVSSDQFERYLIKFDRKAG